MKTGASLTLLASLVVLAALVALALPLPAAADGGGASGGSGSAGGKSSPAPMVGGRTKSNGSGVSIGYRLDGTPKAGAPLTVVLSFDGITDPAGATVRLVTDGGLALAGSSDSTLALPGGGPSNATVDVVPGASGIGYLHVFTTQNGSTSVISVPVQVGQAPASLASPAGAAAKQTPSGDKILPMQVK
jgi:hypothetical protein